MEDTNKKVYRIKAQKVTAILRKAGFSSSKWDKASRKFTPGYNVSKVNLGCISFEFHGMSDADRSSAISKAREAIKSAGLTNRTPWTDETITAVIDLH